MSKTLRLFVYALLLATGPLGAQDYIPEELEGCPAARPTGRTG